jgi:uroporphyrinogen-III synthase
VSPALQGVRVVVTRPAGPGMNAYLEAFASSGARAVALSMIEVVPPEDPRPLVRAAAELPLYDWIALTSGNAVLALLDATGGAVPNRIKVAVVGAATADVARSAGIEPHLVASRSDAEGLADALGPRVAHRRVLLPQAADAAPTLAARLRQGGAEVVAVEAYAKRIPPAAFEQARELFQEEPLGWVTFTSPSTFRNFRTILGEDWTVRHGELKAASIGPVTSAALRDAGIEPACQAREPTAQSLVDAVARAHGSG